MGLASFVVLVIVVLGFVAVSISSDDWSSESDYEGTPFAAGQSTAQSEGPLNCLNLGARTNKWLDRWMHKKTEDFKVQLNFASRATYGNITIRTDDIAVIHDLDFKIHRRTIILSHGYHSKGIFSWLDKAKNLLLTLEDANIIIIDWSKESRTWNYYKAAVNSRNVGDQVVTFLEGVGNEMITRVQPDPSQWGPIYCIGHSLGAHICGYIANQLKRQGSPWHVSRISAMDPAQPCFVNSPEALFLDKNDADFVDVIHTNGRALSDAGMGLQNPVGHIDFYVNGGKIQPGCLLPKKRVWGILWNKSTWKMSKCSHARARDLFIQSLTNAVEGKCAFWGYPWNRSNPLVIDDILDKQSRSEPGCAEMGFNAERYKDTCSGTLLVITSAHEPYCDTSALNRDELLRLMSEN